MDECRGNQDSSAEMSETKVDIWRYAKLWKPNGKNGESAGASGDGKDDEDGADV